MDQPTGADLQFGSPPAARNRSRWAVGGPAIPAVLIAVFLALSAFGLWSYSTADHLGIFNSLDVIETVESACLTMESEVSAVPPLSADARPQDLAQTIQAQNEALERLTATVRSLGQERLDADHPAQYWLSDWDTLIRLRAEYAANVEAGKPATLVIPEVDGIPITNRMSSSGATCSIPRVLTELPPTR